MVQRVDDHNRPIGKPLEVKQVEIVGSSHWHHRWTPKENTIIQCNKYGRCMFLSTRRSPDMMRMYSYVMTTSISEIRARNVWNFVGCGHYFVHVSISTEPLAETVGSFLAALCLTFGPTSSPPVGSGSGTVASPRSRPGLQRWGG